MYEVMPYKENNIKYVTTTGISLVLNQISYIIYFISFAL